MMFYSAVAHERPEPPQAAAQERSKPPLHNFVLPNLKWGSQRQLRCMKVDSNGNVVSSSSTSLDGRSNGDGELYLKKRKEFDEFRPESSKKRKREDSDDGIANLREKLLLDLRMAAENMKVSVENQREENQGGDDETALGDAARPWNLRTRRAACRAPAIEIGGGSIKQGRHEPEQELVQLNVSSEKLSPKSLRLRGLAEMAAGSRGGVEKERRKFSVSLTRNEIKDDLLMMTGRKPARRPKKRPRSVQKQLNNLFPGFWLTEVTPDSYRVPDETV